MTDAPPTERAPNPVNWSQHPDPVEWSHHPQPSDWSGLAGGGFDGPVRVGQAVIVGDNA